MVWKKDKKNYDFVANGRRCLPCSHKHRYLLYCPQPVTTKICPSPEDLQGGCEDALGAYVPKLCREFESAACMNIVYMYKIQVLSDEINRQYTPRISITNQNDSANKTLTEGMKGDFDCR